MRLPDNSDASEMVLRALARRATGMSGAEIADLIREARRVALREKRSLSYSDVENALLERRPPKSQQVLLHQAVHEAGHAVAQICLGVGTIKLITLDGQFGSAYVLSQPRHPRELTTEADVQARMVAYLAGRAAEQLLCAAISGGSGGAPVSDLAQATRLAYSLETTLGYATEHPLLYREVADPYSFLSVNGKVAERVNRRLERAYEKAMGLVERHRIEIERLASVLLREGTLEGRTLEIAIAEVQEGCVPACKIKIAPLGGGNSVQF